MGALAVDNMNGANNQSGGSGTTHGRWRLNRAGIINVYQYENEVLDFAGGRLLLRGVNGSGKSTAMNMLLPFLLTARPGRIDAAGEQTGILKSWMLSGREDAQPVGYLWIEFENRGEFLVCGCGIKANRHSDTVSTWWFVTPKRPGLDLHLVAGHQPLSAEGLRAALDGDEVFGDRRRSDYRHAVQQRLFGGAPIDQHIGLIHVVRNPRVGDRIDIDLPEHLVEALPQLSEQALAEAGQPLDDLEEHRRNVADLDRTFQAINGLLDVYRSYCADELRRRTVEGRSLLSLERGRVREEKRTQRAAEAAAAELAQLDEGVTAQERTAGRLRSEISALEESRAYREGRQLDALRDLVKRLVAERDSASERVVEREARLEAATGELLAATERGRSDVVALNRALADAAELIERCRVGGRPPEPIEVAEATLDAASEPVNPVDASVIGREITASVGAVRIRLADTDQVDEALGALDAAENALSLAESRFEAAARSADQASARLAEQDQRLAAARRSWHDSAWRWASEARLLVQGAGLDTTAASVLATVETGGESADSGLQTIDSASGASDRTETLREQLSLACDELVGHWHESAAAVGFRLEAERDTVNEAQALVDALAERSELEPPRLGWQTEAEYCLADLVDFKPHLTESERCGVEAALESSGLLSARLLESGALELSSGELVAATAEPVASPLSDCLDVTVPVRLGDRVDAESVQRLLGSISSDSSSGAVTVVATDGSFRIGALHGRHLKNRPEFVGTTARSEALGRERREASARLNSALGAVRDSETELTRHRSSLDEAQRLRERLPSMAAIRSASAEVAAAAQASEEASAGRDAAAAGRDEAERASSAASNELQRISVTLQLPRERSALDAVRAELRELTADLHNCHALVVALARSIDSWRGSAARLRTASDDESAERAHLSKIESELDRESARLATIEDSIGAEYAEVAATRDRCRAELEQVESRLPGLREQRDAAVSVRADAQAAARVATAERTRAAETCEAARSSLSEALSVPGLLDALSPLDDSAPPPIVAEARGSKGLQQMLDAVDRLLDGTATVTSGSRGRTADEANETPGSMSRTGLEGPVGRVRDDGAPDSAPVSADSVRQSLRRRRDALGAGWDADERQPDPALPLEVEVSGPSGRAPLAASARAVSAQRDQMAALLDHKQSEALRELLQGLIAREIAERVHGAARLVERMNERLGAVRTAHDVGIRLRWRRSGELDTATNRMIDLLTKLPDLRTDDDESALRQALSDHLREARALQPDIPYRQLISKALDYKRWHDMAVMVRRPGHDEKRLSRNTPLSEGEKKLVTYLPLFAAVAASCDSMAEQAGTASADGSGVARFVVLDDAFAKVSEDNHAKLFGLLVELDLDLIATSERLWGTHATVPELAITEVVRDARLGTILLEHYRWDGATLERSALS